MKKYERVKALVSLDAIAHNFEEMHRNVKEGTRIIAVIKADGYGQDNDGAQKDDFLESHRHRHRLDGDVCAADEKCRENNPKRTHGCISVSCQPQIQRFCVCEILKRRNVHGRYVCLSFSECIP